MPRRVGEDEAPPRRGEVAVGDVDRDALLALGAQPIREKSQIYVSIAAPAARLLDVRELVLEDLLRVVEQAPDQRALAVVDRARRGHTQERRGMRRRERGRARAVAVHRARS